MCQCEGSNNAPTLADNSFDAVESTAHCPDSGGLAGIICHSELVGCETGPGCLEGERGAFN